MKHGTKDETGNRYGRLMVLSAGPQRTDGQGRRWMCRCDCGREVEVKGTSLRLGTSRSCGCVSREGEGWSEEMDHMRFRAAPAAPVREPKCRIYDAECISPAECQLDDDSAPCRVGDQLAFVEACKAPVGTVEHRWSDKCPWTTFHPDQASLLAPRSLALSQFRRKPAPPAPKPGRRSVGESRDISTPREIVHRAFKTATSRAGVSPFCCMPDGKHPCGVLCDTLTAAVEEDRAAAAREAIACVKRISAANDCWTADEILDAARLELLGEGEVKRG